MRQLYEEIKNIECWCSACPHSDSKRDTESRENKYGLKHVYTSFHPLTDTSLLDAITVTRYVEKEETEEEKKAREWKEWEEDYEFYLGLKKQSELKCPFLKKKNLTINLNRDIIIPEKETEILQLLDLISQCYTEECTFNRKKHLRDSSIDGTMQIAIAKIDFALIERGLDFGKLMHNMYFSYYERKADIYKCGYSWDLIYYYLNKHNIPLLSNKEYEQMDGNTQDESFDTKEEFFKANSDSMCDEKGKIQVPIKEFVNYLANSFEINNHSKELWQRFDLIFIDENNTPITYSTLIENYTIKINYEFPPELVNEYGQMLVTRADFVRYCIKHKLFEPYNKKAWLPLDHKLRDANNKTIAARQYSQTYQDLMNNSSLY